jgi:amidase
MDSIGPMCRNVADCAAILSCIAGPDPLDQMMLSQPSPVPDYLKALRTDAFCGVRLGIPRVFMNNDSSVNMAFDKALRIIQGLVATIIDAVDFPANKMRKAKANEQLVMNTDFKVRVSVSLSLWPSE